MKLFKHFKSLFGTSENQFQIIDATINALPDVNFQQIQDREKDGLIVRNFISPEDCKLLVENLEKENENFNSPQHPIFPSSFAQIDRDSKDFKAEMESYFSKSLSFVDSFSEKYGFNIIDKVTGIFSHLNPSITPDTPLGFDGKGCYIPGTFRIQHPEKVSINLHCGNQFIHLFPKYYEHLSSTVDVMDQLSYFIMLQEPDEGGRLILYDVSWSEAQDCNSGTNSIITRDGKTIPLDVSKSIQSSKLDIRTGDLLVFSGGKIWHAVEQVTGNTKRITYGGFVAFGKGNNTSNFYLWS
ncbi:MAG: hypothetical protein AB8B56_06250 [Crocinitomicaceae bacterium]